VDLDFERFHIHPYRSRRLQQYFSRMSKDNEHVIVDDNVASVLSVQGFAVEDAPRSVFKTEQLYESLARYAPGIVSDPTMTPELRSGLALARTCFKRPSDIPPLEMLPMTLETVKKVTSNPSGSPGLTDFGNTKAESMELALERGIETLTKVKAPEPCIAFARTQFEDKTRLIWGFPYSQTAIEGLLAWPLLQEFKGRNTPMAFAVTTGTLGTKLRVASYHKEFAYSIDMSKFDSSISKFLILEAFKILWTWFDPTSIEPVTGLTMKQVGLTMESYFITSPIVMPNGMLYKGRKHGVPSGSFFTQMIDSVVNVIIAGTISSRFRLHVSKDEIFVLGDDLLLWTNRDMELEAMSKYASSVFHVEFNPSKSRKFRYNESIHFLGRNWTQGVPDLPKQDILARMKFPERFRLYSRNYETRKRQVRMLILSYASVYWSAWDIARQTLGTGRWWESPGAIETYVYYHDGKPASGLDLEPDHLSGLLRYIQKYVQSESHGMPRVAIQFWL